MLEMAPTDAAKVEASLKAAAGSMRTAILRRCLFFVLLSAVFCPLITSALSEEERENGEWKQHLKSTHVDSSSLVQEAFIVGETNRSLTFWWQWLTHRSSIFRYSFLFLQVFPANCGNLAENFKLFVFFYIFLKCDKSVEKKTVCAGALTAGHLVQSEQPGAANTPNCWVDSGQADRWSGGNPPPTSQHPTPITTLSMVLSAALVPGTHYIPGGHFSCK